jgi:hypothetical protein
VLLTITTTRAPATDLGYLLHKHPDRAQSFAVAAGQAHVFYPEAAPERCTAAQLLEVDPIGLVRGHKGQDKDIALGQYVNDRPYAASSMLAVAIKEAFRTALTGRCDARPALAASRIPLAISVPALRCRGGGVLAQRVFAPLGWTVEAHRNPLTPPEWGDSPYLGLRLTGELRLADALNHLYVLLPVLDDAKHYWVSTEEVDKLIRAGGDWLAGHPEKELITRRYLSHQKKLTRSALARLAEADDTEPEDLDNAVPDEEPGTERWVPLVELRKAEGNRATAARASRPAAISTDGFEVLVQLVIAAITTEPWPISKLPCAVVTDLVVARLPGAAWPPSADQVSIAAASAPQLSPRMPLTARRHARREVLSGTRSWGRAGPASDGSTVDRSSDSVSTNRSRALGSCHSRFSLV